MKIDEIKIKGFKRIQKADLSLGPGANLFLGHNGEGKTSLQEAIRYALTETIQGRPKKDFPEIINTHCKSASVDILGQSENAPFKIRRTLSKTNRSGPSPVQVGAQLGVDPEILAACLDSNHYFELSPADQKRLITKALGLNPTEEEAAKILEERELAEDERQITWNKPVVQAIGEEGWEAGHSMAYSLRREAGQAIKILKEDQPPIMTSVSLCGDTTISMETILASDKKKPLSEREKEHKVKLKGLYEELGGFKAISKAEMEEAQEQLEEAKTKLAENEKLPVWTKEDTANLKEFQKAKDEFEAKKAKDISDLESLVEATKKTLADNKASWESDLKCPIPDQSGYKMCPAISPDWSSQEKEVDDLEGKIRKIKITEFPGQTELDNLLEKGAACKEKLIEKKSLKKEIKDLEQKLKTADPKALEKKESIEANIAKLEQAIDNIATAKAAIAWNQESQKKIDATRARIEEEEEKREYYDNLCKLLAPDSLPGQLAASKLGVLNNRLKRHSEILGVDIAFTEELDLAQPGGKPIWVMGGSEQARAKMAIAEALSYCAGIGLVLLDEVNISVAWAAKQVQIWLVEVGKETQIVACAATNALGPPKVSKVSPIKVFWVENGEIR